VLTFHPSKFEPGDIVYARWHGGELFEVMEQVFSEAIVPQYKCKEMNSNDHWIFSQLQLSKHDIFTKLKGSNRRQLKPL